MCVVVQTNFPIGASLGVKCTMCATKQDCTGKLFLLAPLWIYATIVQTISYWPHSWCTTMYTTELEGQSKLFHMHKQKSTPQSTSKNYFIDNFFTFTTKQSTPVIAQENYFHQPTILLTRPMQPGKCMRRIFFSVDFFPSPCFFVVALGWKSWNPSWCIILLMQFGYCDIVYVFLGKSLAAGLSDRSSFINCVVYVLNVC